MKTILLIILACFVSAKQLAQTHLPLIDKVKFFTTDTALDATLAQDGRQCDHARLRRTAGGAGDAIHLRRALRQRLVPLEPV